jgi:broad specificity phosphatase PhoE
LEGTQAVKYILPNKHSDVDHIKDVETLENLQIRAVKALEYIESLKDFDNILIVSHGAFGRALRRAVRKLPHTHELKDYEPINNAEIVELI